ncbi:MAG TPA: NAD(P)H-dependent glycerol-3-phosphate dehydrogenase [Parachlamydiaceae bacterium]|nr:NAD(P)H-dependent glycerol-3-phosphate dehydrogenase [Parachlamydiaceae bacterium]
MKISVLGTGSWGFSLASLLASKGYSVISWTTKEELAKDLNASKEHPFLKGAKIHDQMHVTTDLKEALHQADVLVESVTSAGLRPVFEQVKAIEVPNCPIILTSKGIEQGTGLILPEVIIEILGENSREKIGFLSGPSYASEVVKKLPTSVVGSSFSPNTMQIVCDLFTTKTFRVYPNSDIVGVSYGGALKNIIAIACGISEGLGLGYSAKAALMTRGLHEMRKLAIAKGAKPDTLNGLSGMGDLCVTCSSVLSRNYKFGLLLAEGLTPDEAKEKIQMVVEGAYTCISALQAAKSVKVEMPIAEAIYQIIYSKMTPSDAVSYLMEREIKKEHL